MTLLLTAGGNPLPLLLAIRYLRPDKVVLLVTPESALRTQGLREVLDGEIVCELVEVGAHDALGIRVAAAEVDRRHGGVDLVYTGGTKVMAATAAAAVSGTLYHVLDTDKGSRLVDNKPGSLPVEMGGVSLSEVLRIHGETTNATQTRHRASISAMAGWLEQAGASEVRPLDGQDTVLARVGARLFGVCVRLGVRPHPPRRDLKIGLMLTASRLRRLGGERTKAAVVHERRKDDLKLVRDLGTPWRGFESYKEFNLSHYERWRDGNVESLRAWLGTSARH